MTVFMNGAGKLYSAPSGEPDDSKLPMYSEQVESWLQELQAQLGRPVSQEEIAAYCDSKRGVQNEVTE